MKEKNNFKEREKELIQAMKEFNNYNIKKCSVEEYSEALVDYESAIQVYYRDLGKKEKSAHLMKNLYQKMTNEKFIKAFKKAMKKEQFEKPYWFAPVIHGFMLQYVSNQDKDQEILDEYVELFDKILKKRIKKFNKETGITSPLIAKELLALVPEEDYTSNVPFRKAYHTQRVLTKLYALVNKESYLTEFDLDSTSQIGDIFGVLFGEEENINTAINILLEKKEYLQNLNKTQQKMWNLITSWALEVLEEQDKKTIKKAIKYYLGKRMEDDEKNKDRSRRIGLTSISPELYPTIVEVVENIKAKDEKKKEKYIKELSKGKKKKNIDVDEELKKVKWKSFYL